jgi:hypothetical protein
MAAHSHPLYSLTEGFLRNVSSLSYTPCPVRRLLENAFFNQPAKHDRYTIHLRISASLPRERLGPKPFPADLQKAMSSFVNWFEQLSATGVLKGGQPLLDDARLVSGRNGRTVADGPFAESKEAVGGYFLVKAGSFRRGSRNRTTMPHTRIRWSDRGARNRSGMPDLPTRARHGD